MVSCATVKRNALLGRVSVPIDTHSKNDNHANNNPTYNTLWQRIRQDVQVPLAPLFNKCAYNAVLCAPLFNLVKSKQVLHFGHNDLF